LVQATATRLPSAPFVLPSFHHRYFHFHFHQRRYHITVLIDTVSNCTEVRKSISNLRTLTSNQAYIQRTTAAGAQTRFLPIKTVLSRLMAESRVFLLSRETLPRQFGFIQVRHGLLYNSDRRRQLQVEVQQNVNLCTWQVPFSSSAIASPSIIPCTYASPRTW
jgi:hypothetical protein